RFLSQSSATASDCVHVSDRRAWLGFLSRRRSAARPRLFREHVRLRPRATWRGLAERDSLPTVLPAFDRDRRARGLGRPANLGLDATDDVAEDGALFRSRLARVGRARDPGIQPVYLFHFLKTNRDKRT